MMFELKKIIGALLMPLPLISLLMIITLILLVTNKKRLASATLLISTMALFLVSTPWFNNWALNQLEVPISNLEQHDHPYIVVLGCGHKNDDSLPLSDKIYSHCLPRIVRGVELWYENPSATLLLSGYGGTDDESNAVITKRLAIAMGVKSDQILINELAKDTEQEAKGWQVLLTGNRYILISEASHLKRASQFFEKAGLDQFVLQPSSSLHEDIEHQRWYKILPDARYLSAAQRVFYETMGLAWQQLKAN